MIQKQKVLILGSTGLLGHQLFYYLKANSDYDIFNIAFRTKLQLDTVLVDVRNVNKLIKHIKNFSPDYIVNCVGVLTKSSEIDPEYAIFINAYLPHKLVNIANQVNAKLIHISTDCVFSGKKGKPYLESDQKDGEGYYAKTKGLGEILSDKHLTLRTSVIGPELKNGISLFHWFMNQKDNIQGYKYSIWSGVTSFELAKAIHWAINNEISGLYHITNNTQISKYDLITLFKKYTKKEIEIIPVDGDEINKSFIDTRRLMNYEIPSYDQMIFDMVCLIANNRSLYSQYKVGAFDKE